MRSAVGSWLSITRRIARLSAIVALGAAAALTLPVATGTAAAATPTINCDTAPHPSADWSTCQKLVGTASCAFNNQDGTWTVALGYKNPTTSNLFASIPDGNGAGANNSLKATSGSAADPNHISTFWPGTSVTAFTVTWSPTRANDPVTWTLMGHSYRFTERSQPLCTTRPVPIMGNMMAVGIGLGLLLGAFVLVNRRQLAGLHRAPWARA